MDITLESLSLTIGQTRCRTPAPFLPTSGIIHQAADEARKGFKRPGDIHRTNTR